MQYQSKPHFYYLLIVNCKGTTNRTEHQLNRLKTIAFNLYGLIKASEHTEQRATFTNNLLRVVKLAKRVTALN